MGQTFLSAEVAAVVKSARQTRMSAPPVNRNARGIGSFLSPLLGGRLREAFCLLSVLARAGVLNFSCQAKATLVRFAPTCTGGFVRGCLTPMKTKILSFEAKVALGLGLTSGCLYLIHFVCFRDLQYLWLSTLTNLAFLPVSVLVVTLIIDRLLTARERALRREKLRMLISVFFSSLGNRLLEILFRCDSGAHDLCDHLGTSKPQAGKRGGKVNVVVACHCYKVCARQADFEELRGLLTRKMDILLRLLENPSLHEHESFAEVLRTVFHLAEELSLKEDFWEVSDSDREHLTADVNRCYGLLVREWERYLEYLEGNYPYLFSLAVRTGPLGGYAPDAGHREAYAQIRAA